MGEDHRIVHDPDGRRGVWRGPDHHRLRPGRHLPRRLGDFLKREVRQEIGQLAREKAARIEREIGRISLRDTLQPLGQLFQQGDMNFSLAADPQMPEFVLDYVVAHEVAHLAELNHSRRFKLTDSLTGEMERAKVPGPPARRPGPPLRLEFLRILL